MSSKPSPPKSTSSSSEPSPRHPSGNVHLLVLIHGMWGNPSHLAELYRIMCETRQQASLNSDSDARLEVLIAETNRDESTYDGIDWGGERVTDEILTHVENLKKNTDETVTKLSVTGYSLGGLVARYVLGVLYQRKFFDTIQPVNFNTFATPHIGLPRYDSFLNKVFRTLGPKLLSRTGGQFYTVDKWSPKGRPLIEVMADPGQIFYKALCLFPNITIYANAINDLTVPYVTAAIEAKDPFVGHKEAGLTVEWLEGYKPIFTTFHKPDKPPAKKPKTATQRVSGFLTNKNPGPPFLQFGFPGNLVMWVVVPMLMPALFTIAYVRLSLSTRNSRSRIALLEADESFSSKLVHAVAALERDMETTVMDMVDQPTDSSLRERMDDPGSVAPTAPTSGTSTPAPAPLATPSGSAAAATGTSASPLIDTSAIAATDLEANSKASKSKRKSKAADKSSEPILSDIQLRIVDHLNRIPQLKKQLVFIHQRNSHATIVARDVKRFDFHKDGWGVIQHWADHFVL